MCALCEGACIEVDRDISEFCGHRERCSVKLRAGLRIAAQVLLVAFQSQAVAEAGPPVGGPAPPFFCNPVYSLTRSKADMAVLRKSLARYPVAELGEWTWVLVRSADWK